MIQQIQLFLFYLLFSTIFRINTKEMHSNSIALKYVFEFLELKFKYFNFILQPEKKIQN
jgi:hypothetical protein